MRLPRIANRVIHGQSINPSSINPTIRRAERGKPDALHTLRAESSQTCEEFGLFMQRKKPNRQFGGSINAATQALSSRRFCFLSTIGRDWWMLEKDHRRVVVLGA